MDIIHNIDRGLIADTIKDIVQQEDEESLEIIAEVLMNCKYLMKVVMNGMTKKQPDGILDILSILSDD